MHRERASGTVTDRNKASIEVMARMRHNTSHTDPRENPMIAPESFAEILGLGTSIRTVEELETAVSAGLPKRSLERLSARLHSDRRTRAPINSRSSLGPPGSGEPTGSPSTKAKRRSGWRASWLRRSTFGTTVIRPASG
jgi:hypothetical protein